MNPRNVLQRGGDKSPVKIGDKSPHSKVSASVLWPAMAIVFLATLCGAHAQTYSIDWHTIDGGGGTSAGGVFSVSGTVGQPDAGGPLSGGVYSLTGGYWALPVAVQTPGAPRLTIVRFGPGQARVSWTPDLPGFVLQETLSLAPANWVNSASGAANPATVAAPLPTKFYRLRRP